MKQIPRDNSLDSSLALLRDPYRFIGERCRRYGTDLFETRLLLQKTICMSGPEAARLFYEPGRFVRAGVAPGRIRKTLFGEGGVQGLDDDAHRHRKQMFMSLMTPQRVDRLSALAIEQWHAHVARWATMERVVLYDAVQELLMRAACVWADIPLPEIQVARRTRDIAALFDGAGAIGPPHWRARIARRRMDRWIAEIIEQVRAGSIEPPEQGALYAIAWHRDLDGQLLPVDVAAVEILNLVRPTVAVAVYVVWIAHALHRHPQWRDLLWDGDQDYPQLFVQEVRRWYPFFPLVAARTRVAFEWQGYAFPAGRRVMLDLYGTNHDPRTWDAPEQFDPLRFRRWDQGAFNFIPQGGGDPHANHRCPGESITIELMKVAAAFLSRHIRYELPAQDLRIAFSRMPALPKGRFALNRIERLV